MDITTTEARALYSEPRGGAPAFVKVADDHTLPLPDSPGNNRLDSFRNIVETGSVGLRRYAADL